ncbi:PREDICTED: aspartic proteinase CDR1-like [Populus euphratica]|uniref:Aspartic proteinase CDR1-like n=1 Tax=Populus euphratica TaxID=75702 RepID=A0AAJ6V6H1_POPEU|nr:PREDICTED: aspartic proteinase CDR1-like [Populus euphratica]
MKQYNGPDSGVSSDMGQYLLKFSIGSPPADIYGIVDTGSDLMWTQCQPCEQCYRQINPIYNPKSSSTYTGISCQSNECHLLDTATCSAESLCNYTYAYASSSFTKGVLAKEAITFSSSSGGQPVSVPDIVFGCGHSNTGFNEREMGLVGLGGRPLSLASQIGSYLGNRKFSYCLVPFHTDPSISSKMYFGDGSEIIGEGVVSTPLVRKEDPTYYYVTVEGISVGDKFLPYNSSGTASEGIVFIDTGVPPTILPRDFYNRLEREVKNSIPMTPYQDPQLGTQLCYRSNTTINAPILTVHFGGGAQVPLVPTSTFISPKQDVFCFAMTTTDAAVGIFGNFAQSNFRVGFDVDRQTVSFKQVDCTKE